MRIGQLAAEAGVNVQTVRYYERRGMVTEPPRTASGYRRYGLEALDRIRFIKRAQALGFSLRQIEELLALRADSPFACPAVEARTRAKIEDVEQKIRELEAMKRVLERLAAACAAREPTEECPVLEMIAEVGDS